MMSDASPIPSAAGLVPLVLLTLRRMAVAGEAPWPPSEADAARVHVRLVAGATDPRSVRVGMSPPNKPCRGHAGRFGDPKYRERDCFHTLAELLAAANVSLAVALAGVPPEPPPSTARKDAAARKLAQKHAAREARAGRAIPLAMPVPVVEPAPQAPPPPPEA